MAHALSACELWEIRPHKAGMTNKNKIMIQFGNKKHASQEMILRLNGGCLGKQYVEKACKMASEIERSRSRTHPKVGDMVVFISEYGDRSATYTIDAEYGGLLSIKLSAGVALIKVSDGNIILDADYGLFRLESPDNLEFKCMALNRFKYMVGDDSADGRVPVYLDAEVCLWECQDTYQQDNDTTETCRMDKLVTYRIVEHCHWTYNGCGLTCKDDKDFMQFVDDHDGTVFVGGPKGRIVIWCYYHADTRLSDNEWEKINAPVVLRKIQGKMLCVKIVKNKSTHTTIYYYKEDDTLGL